MAAPEDSDEMLSTLRLGWYIAEVRDLGVNAVAANGQPRSQTDVID